MIDRYAIYSDFATIVKRYALKGEEFTVPNYNAAPAQQLPLISNISKNEVSFYYWGINKEWSNNKPIAAKLLSAPKDQLLIRTTLMNALTKRRCLIPVNGFYLWKQYSKKRKTPHFFFIPNQALFSLPGIWEEYEDIDGKTNITFKIIETNNYVKVVEFGEYMPAIVPRDLEYKWLDSYSSIDELTGILDNLDLAQQINFHPVSPHISNLSINSADLIKPQQQVDQLGNYTLFE